MLASHFNNSAGLSGNFSFGSAFTNVTLPPGARAEIWAGMRGGHFETLSASASLTWLHHAAAGTGELIRTPAPAPEAIATAAAGAATPVEQTSSVAMPAPRSFTKPSKAVAVLNFTAPPNFNPAENMVRRAAACSCLYLAAAASVSI